MRGSGQRTLGEMTAFDFVLLLIIAETTQQALLGNDYSISNAVLLIRFPRQLSPQCWRARRLTHDGGPDAR